MRFLKFTILFILVSINVDVLSQWVSTDNYTNVGTQNNLNIEFTTNIFEVFSEILKNNLGDKDFSYLKEFLK